MQNNIINELSEKEKILKGENIVNILMLREDRSQKYNPKRYLTQWGNKTALGIYATVKRLIDE